MSSRSVSHYRHTWTLPLPNPPFNSKSSAAKDEADYVPGDEANAFTDEEFECSEGGDDDDGCEIDHDQSGSMNADAIEHLMSISTASTTTGSSPCSSRSYSTTTISSPCSSRSYSTTAASSSKLKPATMPKQTVSLRQQQSLSKLVPSMVLPTPQKSSMALRGERVEPTPAKSPQICQPSHQHRDQPGKRMPSTPSSSTTLEQNSPAALGQRMPASQSQLMTEAMAICGQQQQLDNSKPKNEKELKLQKEKTMMNKQAMLKILSQLDQQHTAHLQRLMKISAVPSYASILVGWRLLF